MRNPLNRRWKRELKSDFGKYAVLFLFIAGMIAIVSGFLVANDSMSAAYDESFAKYKIEDGNFELAEKADEPLLRALETDGDVTLYENFYVEEETKEKDSTLRIFKNRTDIDGVCVMKGRLPEETDEIAIDRMYADNNKLSVGDTLTVEKNKLTITGLVALSDYSALFSNNSDLMFDAVKFGVAVVTEEGFDSFGDTHLHTSYSWKYEKAPKDDDEAKTMAEDFMETITKQAALTNFNPQYLNQAIHFTGDDIVGDNSMFTVFLYIVIVILAFIMAITTTSTIFKEANVIGTLRASGYTKGELVRHYLAMPLFVMFLAAVVGNILGYTLLKGKMAAMYYNSYSLPTYVTKWNADAFVKTTVIPLLLMFFINFIILEKNMQLSPLQFIRRDLSRRTKKKAFRLNTKIPFLIRFRLRVIFQNLSGYLMVVIGVFFANFILLFGLMLNPLLDHFSEEIINSMPSTYQYVLKAPLETDTDGAEQYQAGALKTLDGDIKSEEVMVYGLLEDSAYLPLHFTGDEVYLSSAYADKYEIKAGDKITLKEQYKEKEHTFTVSGIYDYPSSIAIFMNQKEFCTIFDKDEGYFNGYFSNTEISDIEEKMIATTITRDDLTKTSRQLKVSMGTAMQMFFAFGIAMFILMIYLLSKIIIEKNMLPISMTKILGYSNREINGLYVMSTTIVVVLSLLVTMPVCNTLMEGLCREIFKSYSGYFPYYVPGITFAKMFTAGIISYLFILLLQMRRLKAIPMNEALKNVE